MWNEGVLSRYIDVVAFWSYGNGGKMEATNPEVLQRVDDVFMWAGIFYSLHAFFLSGDTAK